MYESNCFRHRAGRAYMARHQKKSNPNNGMGGLISPLSEELNIKHVLRSTTKENFNEFLENLEGRKKIQELCDIFCEFMIYSI